MKAQDYNISSEKFKFRSLDEKIHDKKLETKPVGYFKDALYRFTRNKGSIFAAFIIGFLLLFSLIGPYLTPYKVIDKDSRYANVLPKNELFVKLGIHFWDGTEKVKGVSQVTKDKMIAIEIETGADVIIGDIEEEVVVKKGKETIEYSYRADTYAKVGVIMLSSMSNEEYLRLQQYQNETGIQVIFPITDTKLRTQAVSELTNANIWFKTLNDRSTMNQPLKIAYDENGDLIPIYRSYTGYDNYNSLRIEGDTPLYDYAIAKQNGTQWEVRVKYDEYYKFTHSVLINDKIDYPSFLFGADSSGRDVFVCLASGARFSFVLAIIVAVVNLFIGAIYGAIEGYYGGKLDLFMERVSEILGAIPSMIVITLLRYHLKVDHWVVLFISFFLTGWIGMASRTRMQFYRFKNQEYVLVARTLGANDRRIMFKHIFPNAIGTLITGSVLVIPSVIFSETSLSYLGIINLETGNLTSVGTLLANGQTALYNFPHIILFPSLFISLLMLSFNLFGNGLRDAFNPSLRGSEE